MKSFKKIKALSFVLPALLLTLLSCRDSEKIVELYSYPHWKEEVFNSPAGKDLFLFITGDLSQNLFPDARLKSPKLPKEMPHAIKLGGAPILHSYMEVIRNRFSDRVALLSFGDLDLRHQDEKIQHSLSKILPLFSFDGVLLGPKDIQPLNHQSFFHDEMEEVKWFNSNILSLKTGNPTELWNSLPTMIIEKNGIKVGLIGVSNFDLLSDQSENQTKNQKEKLVSGHYFQDPVSTVLKMKNTLKKEGAKIIGLFYQGKSECEGQHSPLATLLSELKGLEECDSALNAVIKRLPPRAIDLVISKNTPSFLSHNVPVIGIQKTNEYLTGVRLNFDDEGNINRENSYLLEPLRLCHQTFAGSLDCVLDSGMEEKNEERFEILRRSSFHLLPAKFLGHKITPNQEIIKILNGR